MATEQDKELSVASVDTRLSEVPRIGDVSYLKGRLAQVFDAPGHKRPRWTVTDAHSVRSLVREVEVLREMVGA